ncbi:MAG TPA: DUF3592 domain-containing protein [Terracidiphilus sp.]|nr:DUF3592 domain-containing protein [Terracidiphilus sp.]
MLELGSFRPSLAMILLSNRTTWETAAGITLIAGLTAGAVFYLRRKRPTEDELERARRKLLSQSGRLVDGMLLDIREITIDDGRPLTMLEYSYRSAGVDYECSQDVSTLLTVVDPTQVRAGFPCTVRYQPGNPQNSIVLAESWSGLRSSLPMYPASKRPDLGKLSTDRG